MNIIPSDEVVLTVMKKMAPFLQIQPTTDNELIAIFRSMSESEQEMMFASYGKISWDEHKGGGNAQS